MQRIIRANVTIMIVKITEPLREVQLAGIPNNVATLRPPSHHTAPPIKTNINNMTFKIKMPQFLAVFLGVEEGGGLYCNII